MIRRQNQMFQKPNCNQLTEVSEPFAKLTFKPPIFYPRKYQDVDIRASGHRDTIVECLFEVPT
jgi:hypothetical protein